MSQPTTPFQCPACSNVAGNEDTADRNGVATCTACGGVFTTRHIYLGESYTYVLPRMAGANQEGAADTWRYFDLSTLGSEGLGRRHGWFQPANKLVVQVG
jgi:hypothetical protein